MNTKGFMLSTSIFAIMLISAGIIFTFHTPILNSFVSVKNSETKLIESVQLRNAYERSKGILEETFYEDLNIRVDVREDGEIVFTREGKVVLSLSKEDE